MRLAQDGAFPAPSSSTRRDRRLPRGVLDHNRSQVPLQRKLLCLTRSSSRTLLRKSQSIKSQYLASQIDATWFSSLPQKIQQRQFTREEQVLFAGNRDLVILDAADEALYKLGRQPNTSMGSLRTDTTFQSITNNSNRNRNRNRNNITNPVTEPSVEPAVGMDDTFSDSFRWLDEEDDDLDLALDSYHNAVSETTPISSPASGRSPSFRRTLSLTVLKPRRPSLSLKPPQSSHSTFAPPGSGVGARPLSSLLAPLHQRSASVSSIEPLAQHYQDPEARLKLRVYLASPQKFDEAIEFGFPSLESTTWMQPVAPPTASSRRTEETERSFLDDAVSSPPDDEEDRDDDVSVADTDSPRTPQDTMFHSSCPSKQSSLDRSDVVRPHILRSSPDTHIHTRPGGREMTLHMTLTRPDLRRDTDVTTAPTESDDPLKLSDLPLSDERHPIWDSVPEDRFRMRTLWRKLISR